MFLQGLVLFLVRGIRAVFVGRKSVSIGEEMFLGELSLYMGELFLGGGGL